jgi:thiosulfate/3-mercaptopyruvate sulfurtransferase
MSGTEGLPAKSGRSDIIRRPKTKTLSYDFAMNKALISLNEAIQILDTQALEVLVLEVVSDYYAAPASRKHRLAHSTPNFAQIKTEQLEVDSLWTLKPEQDLQQVLAAAGLTPATRKHILLLDNIQCTCGNLASRFDASARLFSILYYFGFSKVSIIFDADTQSGFPELFAAQHPEAMHPLLMGEPSAQESWIPKHKNHIVNYTTLTRIMSGKPGSYRLLDARSADEFAGITTGYDYIPLAGKIPTAENIINGEYQVSSAESLNAMLTRLQSALEVKNIKKADRIIWYCGTAWRASRMCVLTQALGYTNVAIYDGGWNEWQQLHPGDGIPEFIPETELRLAATIY